MQRHRVTHSLPVSDRAEGDDESGARAARALSRLKLRAIMSAGEAVGDAVFAYCRDALGVTVNEMFGQTEINYIVGNCGRAQLAGARPAAWAGRTRATAWR